MSKRLAVRIGTRPSPLALKQVDEVITLLKKAHSGLNFNIVKIDTLGDKDRAKPLEKLEGTDFFTKEIEQALLQERIDLAIHSAKDLPDVLPKGLEVAAILRPIDPHDVLVSKNNLSLDKLPPEAKIGTSSLRRKVQLKTFRKDFKILDIRGNIEERLKKLQESNLDAIVIAACGLIRLGLEHRITQRLAMDVVKPHPLQGCLAIETRINDLQTKNLVSFLDSREGVYLVGAGPGDPQLITVKGLELIKKADAIVYDFLINKELLSFTMKDTELICAGKSPKSHLMGQNQINRLLEELSKRFRIVVRLKSGDPYIFGRGGEEAVYLAERNVPFHIVPGVSSATGVPASCRIPLTHRDYASSVAIITGHRKGDRGVKSVNADTLVYLMAVSNLERIVNNLLKHGKGLDTSCAVIERGTSDKQKFVQGNLGNILQKSKKAKINPPAVFVVGEVVNLRDILDKSKKRILFTGTNPQKFKDLGRILHQPMIKIVPLDDYGEIKKEIKRINKYHWIIFTSRYGAEYFFDIFNRKKLHIPKVKICAIGETTADRLKEYGVKVDCIPKNESSQGIIETLRKFNLKGKNILIPRSNLSSDYLSCSLKKIGAHVKAIPVYRNIMPSRYKRIDFNKIDEIFFTSPSTIENFMTKYKNIPMGIRIKCIGDITLNKLKSFGFYGEVMAK